MLVLLILFNNNFFIFHAMYCIDLEVEPLSWSLNYIWKTQFPFGSTNGTGTQWRIRLEGNWQQEFLRGQRTSWLWAFFPVLAFKVIQTVSCNSAQIWKFLCFLYRWWIPWFSQIAHPLCFPLYSTVWNMPIPCICLVLKMKFCLPLWRWLVFWDLSLLSLV